MPQPRRWRSLNELREAFAASGIELPRRHPGCGGKVRHGNPEDARRHLLTVSDQRDVQRSERLHVYPCGRCGGFHVGHRGLYWPRRHGRKRIGRH